MAECLWENVTETWTWQYKTASGVSLLHSNTDPCSEPVMCPLPAARGTRYKVQNGQGEFDIFLAENASSNLQLGDEVKTECSAGYLGPGTHKCTDTCEFSPPLRACSMIACEDLLGSQYGFDFATATSDGVDFEKQYELSDAITVQCPKGELHHSLF